MPAWADGRLVAAVRWLITLFELLRTYGSDVGRSKVRRSVVKRKGFTAVYPVSSIYRAGKAESSSCRGAAS
jgi:hypothetical protein